MVKEKSRSHLGYSGFLFILILGSILPFTTLFEGQTFFGRVIFLFTLSLFLLVIAYNNGSIMMINSQPLVVCVLLLSLIYLIHILSGNFELWFNPAYIIYNLVPFTVLLLVIPLYIRGDTFLLQIAIIGSLLVIIAIPAQIFGGYSLILFEVNRFRPYDGFWVEGRYRMNSIFSGSPNQLASLLMISAFASVFVIREINIGLGGTLLLINLYGLVMTNSRGAFGGFLLMLAVFIVISYLVSSGGTTLLSVSLISGVLYGVFTVYLHPTVVPLSQYIDITSRALIWESGYYLIRERPVFGYGIRSYGDLIAQYYPTGETVTPHSTYLRILLSSGIFGVLIYLFMYSYILIKCYNSNCGSTVNRCLFSVVAATLYWAFIGGAPIYDLTFVGVIITISLGLIIADGCSV